MTSGFSERHKEKPSAKYARTEVLNNNRIYLWPYFGFQGWKCVLIAVRNHQPPPLQKSADRKDQLKAKDGKERIKLCT